MELVIVQQNVCGRDVYEGKRNIQDYEILIKEVREENPDIIFSYRVLLSGNVWYYSRNTRRI